jgi:hypothetical protein
MSGQSKASRMAPFVIRHPSLRHADDHLQLDFMGLFVAGLEEWARRCGVDTDSLPERIHVKLMAEIAALLTPENIAQVYNSEDSKEQRQRVEAITDSVKKVSMDILLPLLSQPKPGAKRKHAKRDADIYSLRKLGFSLGQIGKRLKMPRLAAQPAYRREDTRRKKFYELYKELRETLKPLGIVLKEQRNKTTPVAKSKR